MKNVRQCIQDIQSAESKEEKVHKFYNCKNLSQSNNHRNQNTFKARGNNAPFTNEIFYARFHFSAFGFYSEEFTLALENNKS